MSEPGLRKKTPEDFELKKQLWNEVLKDNKGNIGGTVKKGTPQYEAMITKYKALLKKQTPPLNYAPSVHDPARRPPPVLSNADRQTLMKYYYGSDEKKMDEGDVLMVGPRKFYDLMKDEDKEKISRRQVSAWLNAQRSYQLVRSHRLSRSIRPLVSSPFTYFQMDLTDLIGSKGTDRPPNVRRDIAIRSRFTTS